MNKEDSTHIPLHTALRALGCANPGSKVLLKRAESFGLTITGSMPLGRGITYLVTKESFNVALAKRAGQKAAAETAKETGDDPQLHVIALEAKMDRMEAEMKEIKDCLNLILKGSNRMADIVESHGVLLGKIAKDLGCSLT